jgi:hypothetical protein
MDKLTLLEQLERLDFFRYVDPNNLVTVRNGLVDNIINKQAFFFPHGENYKNLNQRLFKIDFEELTEGGALSFFEEIQPALEKAGLQVDLVTQVFNFNVQGSTPVYNFTLNGKTCNLSSVPKLPILLQGFLAKRYINFIDRALRKNKVSERLYLMNDKASDTELAFLTKAQVAFIKSLNLDPLDKPYKLTTSTVFKPVFMISRLILKAIFGKKIKRP